ncbi:MFS transporter [Croceicoccus ponticola]|uniref:MFS transporter n=1 Tax=Croceicoccus ponticola TaxID=2217664 RepID=A0A437H1G2_9SPHN|nr:MFS transporter [Croceicoccus ponticola]RVQ69376.1 MFS transporter [Croceicoccus ponticola]
MAGSLWVLAESRKLRLVAFFLFYFGQGIPVGVTDVAIPIWVAANGGSDTDVALLVGAAFLPWSFKFIPAALMDRYSFLAMGRRRAWLIGAQFLMMGGFLIAAFAAPEPTDIGLLYWVVLAVMGGAAIQDVAVDGLAVDILPDDEQGTASSFMFGGQAVGAAVSGAIGGYALQYWGVSIAFLLFIPVVAGILLWSMLLLERRGERHLPWTKGEASPELLALAPRRWWTIIKTTAVAMMTRDSIVLVLASGCIRAVQGMLSSIWPLFAVAYLAFETSEYSSMVSTTGLISSVVAIGIGAVLSSKMGARRSSVLVASLHAVLCFFLLGAQSLWSSVFVFVALTLLKAQLSTLQSICTNPLRMQLSDKRVAATQFTIYNSLSNLPVTLGTYIFVWLGGMAAIVTQLWVAAGLAMLAAIGMFVLRVGDRRMAAEPVPKMD